MKKTIIGTIVSLLAISAVSAGAVYAKNRHSLKDVKNLQNFLHGRETENLSGADYDMNHDGVWNV